METLSHKTDLDIALNGGVLIIGSLLWDKHEIRENWRQAFLRQEQILFVAAPIRYGRESTERHYTFSMVFSSDCLKTISKAKLFSSRSRITRLILRS